MDIPLNGVIFTIQVHTIQVHVKAIQYNMRRHSTRLHHQTVVTSTLTTSDKEQLITQTTRITIRIKRLLPNRDIRLLQLTTLLGASGVKAPRAIGQIVGLFKNEQTKARTKML